MVLTFVRRSVSPLHFEPVETAAEDILCPGSDEDNPQDGHERERKRLRIENLGKQYLEGKGLFIQSAGLRGPFEEWRNPWAKKRWTSRGLDQAALPQAPNRPGGLEYVKVEQVLGAGKKGSFTGSESITSNGSLHDRLGFSGVPQPEQAETKKRRHPEAVIVKHDQSQEESDANDNMRRQDQNSWLKSDQSYRQRFRQRDSQTPTPEVRPLNQSVSTPFKSRRSPIRARPTPFDLKVLGQKFHTKDYAHYSSNIDEPTVPSHAGVPGIDSIVKNAKDTRIEPARLDNGQNIHVKEGPDVMLDGGTRQSHGDVKQPSQEIALRTALRDRQNQPRKVSQEVFSRAIDNHHQVASSRLKPYVSEVLQMPQSELGGLAGVQSQLKLSKPPLHAVPASDDLAEFQYYFTRNRSSSSSSQEKTSSKNVDGDSRIQPKAKRSTGTPPKSSRSIIAGQAPSDIRREESKTSAQREDESLSRTYSKPSNLSSFKATSSRDSALLPEAQIVPDIPIQLVQLPSGPSTDLMETDKQSPKVPSLDEGDSYMNLSTQAAVLKAQRSFQNDVISPIKASPQHTKKEQISPATFRSIKADKTPLANGRHFTVPVKSETPADEEPMSTQAMADAISPFTISTIKKRPPSLKKRTSFAPSPSKQKSAPPVPMLSPNSPSPTGFRNRSLSMSTSPSPSPSQPSLPNPTAPLVPPPPSNPNTISKPTSSATSFSILPNGTMTETSAVLQDGQQQLVQPEEDIDVSLPLDPFDLASVSGKSNRVDTKDFNLDDAIEDASSFLGKWDVETEARRQEPLNKRTEGGYQKRDLAMEKG